MPCGEPLPEKTASKRGPMGVDLPRLYAILDIDSLLRPGAFSTSPASADFASGVGTGSPGPALRGSALTWGFAGGESQNTTGSEAELLSTVLRFASELVAGGVRLLQYRAKQLPVRTALSHACALRQAFPGIKLIMNDRADLCLAAGFDGVHVGQRDLHPEAVRKLVGQRILGVSTHNPEEIHEAAQGPADYVAIGPVFATTSKSNTSPVVGLEGVRRARQLTDKPLVAIGGITLKNCRQVLEAGADSMAIISALLHEPRRAAEEFLRVLS
jgi:thiamine-phosphate pyrophosphorylase